MFSKINKYLLILSVVLIAQACGGGGGDDRNLVCPNETPLLCEKSETCCPRGLSFFCDGLCSAVPLTPCAEAEECKFKTRGLEYGPIILEDLIEPVPASAPMSKLE